MPLISCRAAAVPRLCLGRWSPVQLAACDLAQFSWSRRSASGGGGTFSSPANPKGRTTRPRGEPCGCTSARRGVSPRDRVARTAPQPRYWLTHGVDSSIGSGLQVLACPGADAHASPRAKVHKRDAERVGFLLPEPFRSRIIPGFGHASEPGGHIQVWASAWTRRGGNRKHATRLRHIRPDARPQNRAGSSSSSAGAGRHHGNRASISQPIQARLAGILVEVDRDHLPVRFVSLTPFETRTPTVVTIEKPVLQHHPAVLPHDAPVIDVFLFLARM